MGQDGMGWVGWMDEMDLRSYPTDLDLRSFRIIDPSFSFCREILGIICISDLNYCREIQRDHRSLPDFRRSIFFSRNVCFY